MKKLKELISKELLLKVFLIIISIQMAVLLFFSLGIDSDNIFELNNLLITSTGIFSAIVIATLLNAISKFNTDKREVREKIAKHSLRLTKFRKVLYFLITSEEIWGKDFYKQFLLPLRKCYPTIDINTSQSDLMEGDPRTKIVTDERFGDKRTRMFLSLLTIVDVRYGQELHLIESLNDSYSAEKLKYIHDSFNNIWRYLEHRRADVDIRYETVNTVFKDSFEKEVIYFLRQEDIKSFDDSNLSELASEFYSDYLERHYVLQKYLSGGMPSLFKYLYLELVILLIVGLIIPLLNISISNFHSETITKFSVVTVLLIFSYIVFHLMDYIFSKEDSRIMDYLYEPNSENSQ